MSSQVTDTLVERLVSLPAISARVKAGRQRAIPNLFTQDLCIERETRARVQVTRNPSTSYSFHHPIYWNAGM